MKEQNALIIFVRNPEWGSIKTRLAKDVGNDTALRIYKYLLSRTRKVTRQAKAEHKFLFYDRHIVLADGWDENTFAKQKQVQGDLGVRMDSAFQQAFKVASKVVIIGSDCPSLKAEDIDEAYMQLDSNDVVIGPSKDGGYYLLGLSKWIPELFKEMPWSTERVMSQTVQTIKALKLSHFIGRELNDIDHGKDWADFQTTSDS